MFKCIYLQCTERKRETKYAEIFLFTNSKAARGIFFKNNKIALGVVKK